MIYPFYGSELGMESLLENGNQEPAFILREDRPGDMEWVVRRHGTLYLQEFGWDSRFEALVAKVVARFVDERDDDRERCWIAERQGAPVGCVFLVRQSEDMAQLRLLLVEPSARGLGIGKRLVAECLAFARAKGYRKMQLWTNSALISARHVYQAAGFHRVMEAPDSSFGPESTSEVWEQDLI